MFFPMYTVSVDVLLQMRKVEPHEELKAEVGSTDRISHLACL